MTANVLKNWNVIGALHMFLGVNLYVSVKSNM